MAAASSSSSFSLPSAVVMSSETRVPQSDHHLHHQGVRDLQQEKRSEDLKNLVNIAEDAIAKVLPRVSEEETKEEGSGVDRDLGEEPGEMDDRSGEPPARSAKRRKTAAPGKSSGKSPVQSTVRSAAARSRGLEQKEGDNLLSRVDIVELTVSEEKSSTDGSEKESLKFRKVGEKLAAETLCSGAYQPLSVSRSSETKQKTDWSKPDEAHQLLMCLKQDGTADLFCEQLSGIQVTAGGRDRSRALLSLYFSGWSLATLRQSEGFRKRLLQEIEALPQSSRERLDALRAAKSSTNSSSRSSAQEEDEFRESEDESSSSSDGESESDHNELSTMFRFLPLSMIHS